ncbi:hypothetical protein PVK06_048010 [Gossypium arboreum]|uniref:Uncharacterized protein n=1 Tax=Gossypium arboreum TaxID=29729 RepID=A0ABR0MFA3_GOSAR|nr:hypothetical protein PVK06_048010 [Gossypium arboreum]
MLLYVDTGYQYDIGERGGDDDKKGEVMVLRWSPLEESVIINNGWRNRGLNWVVKDGWFFHRGIVSHLVIIWKVQGGGMFSSLSGWFSYCHVSPG